MEKKQGFLFSFAGFYTVHGDKDQGHAVCQRKTGLGGWGGALCTDHDIYSEKMKILFGGSYD